MNHDAYDDTYIREILNSVKTIAMVGASPVNVRPSYFAFKYLAERGYDMIPVNPGHVGKSLVGKPFVGSLTDIGRPIDMVDIFRSSSHIMPIVDEALKLSPLPKVIWMQLGARDDAAAAKAEAAGLKVVMNRCPKIEYGRLSSEISWMGVNSRTLSSKRAPMPTQGMRLSLNRISVGGGETRAVRPRGEGQERSARDAVRDRFVLTARIDANASSHSEAWHDAPRRLDGGSRAAAAWSSHGSASHDTHERNQHDRSSSRICHPRRPCRRAARSDHRRAGDADLSDHVVRVQRRRSRRLAVRAAGVRQHLHPDRKPDQRGAGRARRRAGRRHRGARGGLRPRRAGRGAAAIAASPATNSSPRANSMAARSTSSPTPSRASAGTWCGPIPTISAASSAR